MWACTQEGVPAVCLCGEGTPPTPELVAELAAAGFTTAKVVYDLDEAGRKGAAVAAAALRAAGLRPRRMRCRPTSGTTGTLTTCTSGLGTGLRRRWRDCRCSTRVRLRRNRRMPRSRSRASGTRSKSAAPQPHRCDGGRLLTLPDAQGGDGLLPRGKVGILSAAGGTGKTAALVSLAVSAITGRPWFGYYRVPPTVTGRVLLLLAEESEDDAYRRIWKVADALKLTVPERILLDANLIAIPLAGKHVALTAMSGSGLIETPIAGMLRERRATRATTGGRSSASTPCRGSLVEMSSRATRPQPAISRCSNQSRRPPGTRRWSPRPTPRSLLDARGRPTSGA